MATATLLHEPTLTTTLPDTTDKQSADGLEMSYEAFLEWLDEDTHADWVDGKVEMHSPVSAPHNRATASLIWLLKMFLNRHRQGELLFDPFQIKIGPTFPGRAPDIIYIRNENLHRIQQNVLRGAPDLVIEIVSPGATNQRRDRITKFSEYERGGVAEYWLLDPEDYAIEIYRLDDAGKYQPMLPDAEGRYHSAVIPGFWVLRQWVWEEPDMLEVLYLWGMLPASR